MEGDQNEFGEMFVITTNNAPKLHNQADPLFDIITSTEPYAGTWVKHKEGFCEECDSSFKTIRFVPSGFFSLCFKFVGFFLQTV